jgi:hypothetical protein
LLPCQSYPISPSLSKTGDLRPLRGGNLCTTRTRPTRARLPTRRSSSPPFLGRRRVRGRGCGGSSLFLAAGHIVFVLCGGGGGGVTPFGKPRPNFGGGEGVERWSSLREEGKFRFWCACGACTAWRSRLGSHSPISPRLQTLPREKKDAFDWDSPSKLKTFGKREHQNTK